MWGVCQGASSSGPCSKRRLFIASVTTLTCMTTPCPTIGWPLVTWKGSGAYVPLFISPSQATRALTCGYSPTTLPTRLWAQLADESPHFAIFFIFYSLFISKVRL
ncbi:unnamed protein product [Spirodela intermedia]|uniref:Uncharacterized protein n=1 Tax=Spirodela intermedia TaxID=51605 RepID=A0A7I8KUA8_SPIIN|nr:unnamed protein product [Spirodela intermedia]